MKQIKDINEVMLGAAELKAAKPHDIYKLHKKYPHLIKGVTWKNEYATPTLLTDDEFKRTHEADWKKLLSEVGVTETVITNLFDPKPVEVVATETPASEDDETVQDLIDGIGTIEIDLSDTQPETKQVENPKTPAKSTPNKVAKK